MDIVESVNGMTGAVVLNADDIPSTASGQHSIEQVVQGAYVATATAISGTTDDFLLTIARRS